MRKLSLLIAIILGLTTLLLSPEPARACDMSINPSSFTVEAGESVTFTLERYATHRRCTVPLEDTKIRVTGGTITDPGEWQTGSPDRLTFTVQFTTPGEAVVHAERSCDKNTLMVAEARGTSLSPAEANQDASQVPINQTPENNSASATAKASEDVSKLNISTDSISSDETTRLNNTAAASPELSPSQTSAGTNGFLNLQIGDNVRGFWLWMFIVAGGMLLYKMGWYKLRKPWLFVSVVLLGFYLGACPCPIAMLFKVFLGVIPVLLLVITATSVIWGRVFCGWACPLGAVQELLYAPKLRLNIPEKADRALRLVKYGLLLVLSLLTVSSGIAIWCDYDPFKALFNFQGSLAAWLLLVLILGGALFIERFFCRYLCPLGAVLAVFSLIAPKNLKINPHQCSACRKCIKQGCPMGAITIPGHANVDKPSIRSSECINCLKCADSCTKKAVCS